MSTRIYEAKVRVVFMLDGDKEIAEEKDWIASLIRAAVEHGDITYSCLGSAGTSL